MTNLKLTKEQIESLRILGGWAEELAYKVYKGEKVMVERAVEKWEPNHDAIIAARSSRITNACLDLQAYREEFAPGYVVPHVGQVAWTPALCEDGKYRMFGSRDRIVGVIYMPHNICEALCDKLNSGEVEL